MAQGMKGDFAYETTGNDLLNFFSKAGSFSPDQKAFHGAQESGLELFKKAWETDNYKAMQLAMWLRHCRGGSGNRKDSREIFNWIGNTHSEWIKANIHNIPEYGRWDDLISFIGTESESYAIDYWAKNICEGDGLACKWAPREKNNKIVFGKLRKAAKMSPPEFRRLVAKGTKVVETLMCSKQWHIINYNHVPSLAMARSVNAFSKHDSTRFTNWKKSLSDPKSLNKIHAEVLFPHDCIRTLRAELSGGADGYFTWSLLQKHADEKYCDSLIANAQFDALPNYMDGTNMRIITICDFSGSMETPISGSIMGLDVCMGLGLYCSDRLGKDNPFYRKFIPFSDNARFVDWREDTFSVAVQKHNDGFCGNTNIRSALDLILDSAKFLNATNEQMPNCLLIPSDMQWDMGADADKTSVESGLEAWEKFGYKRPKIVYWNLLKYEAHPAAMGHKDVCMVSGFSPSVLKSVVGGEDFSPMAIMLRTISEYEVIHPKEI